MSHSTGNSISPLAPASKFYHGLYGRLCPNLSGWTPSPTELNGRTLDQYSLDFASTQMVELIKGGAIVKPNVIATSQSKVNDLQKKFNSHIPAGYTYFGQFTDHDITFDTTSSLARRNDPQGLFNFRTPRFDLDNIYGRGPAVQPYLYEPDDDGKFIIGRVIDKSGKATCFPDLPRQHQPLCPKDKTKKHAADYKAIIGDKRNDENSMVSQLQLAFLLAHNTLYERAKAKKMDNPFEAARQSLRWLYQWVVWFDFLPRVVDSKIHKCSLQLEKACAGRKVWNCGLDDIYNWHNQPFMPVEFSVAAYRFGHSMVRNSYQTNHPHRGFGKFVPIFDNVGANSPDDLRGFRPMKLDNVLQWDWFLEMQSPRGFPQKARKIDTKLANALCFLHEGPHSDRFVNTLAARNIVRGVKFDLPTGADIARKFCVKATKLTKNEPQSLWYYILKEAENSPTKKRPENHLGPVGSLIVCATLAGILKGDPQSFFNMDPCWTPNDDPLLRKGKDNRDSGKDWELSSIIRLSGLPVNAADVNNVTSNGTNPPV